MNHILLSVFGDRRPMPIEPNVMTVRFQYENHGDIIDITADVIGSMPRACVDIISAHMGADEIDLARLTHEDITYIVQRAMLEEQKARHEKF